MLMEKFKPLDQLMRYVQEQRGKSGIIYCNSRAKVEDTAARLQSKGISAVAYHAGLENNVRATCRRNSSAMTCKLWWRRWRSAWASINQTFASWSL
ncbi:ATP-dependent DNA helicase RecQ [Escherichia coli]|uniref:ATP-dependent DNA helicase RecQ n=1 Tax=Escherichia coli TaxID=562 RepID=A0A2X3M8K6_ECOLX|nr:ATP-dependent DNA helicase RecQ [Escherichia coli]